MKRKSTRYFVFIFCIITYVIFDKLTIYGEFELPTVIKNCLDDIRENKSETEKSYQTLIQEWKAIRAVSNEQKLIPSHVILKTVKFMAEQVPEDDPELIAFVRSLIVPPSKKPILLNKSTNAYYDQLTMNQSFFIDNILKQKRNGFFIEAGAFDGETMSNTLFFELNRNWSGILVEPIPSQYQTILTKHRNTYVLNACIGGRRTVLSKFCVMDIRSGRPDQMADFLLEYIGNKRKNESTRIKMTIFVPCFPLYTILKAINVDRVDYFSLDVEGSEWSVIESLELDKIYIDSLTVEWAAGRKTHDLIIKRLERYNFELFKTDSYDLYFKHK